MADNSNMPRSSTISPEIKRATRAEIARQIAAYETKRRVTVDELAAIHSARSKGQTPEIVPPPNVVAARERAAEMLNGHAPDFLKRNPALTREAALIIEQDAIDIILKVLRDNETEARTFEAAQFAADHDEEWRDLCRDILLTAHRFLALEAKAKALRAAAHGPVTLPLGQFIGTQRSVLNPAWKGADILSLPREAALNAKIITKHDIDEARNV
jgi:hypothetical protein